MRHTHPAFILALVLALVIVAFPANLMAQSPGDDGTISGNNNLGAGLREPTPAERDWVNQNIPIAQKIRLNRLGLERVNAERVAKGLNPYSGNDLDVALNGDEITFNGTSVSSGISSLAVTPTTVDNSALAAFPPIRSQGSIGSCGAWATTYYQLTYETNLARGTTASGGDNTRIFSPKFTYNMVNGGGDNGSYFSGIYDIEMKNGAATWADFPYDTSYLQWPTSASIWRNAINYRPLSFSQLSSADVNILISNLKTNLANGHVVVIATYVSSWASTTLSNDAATADDDAYAGQRIATYLKNSNQGGHAMTIVGYNDNLWCDLNGNGQVDNGEKGAYKIANSWGTSDWNKGYRWVSYDALRNASAVSATAMWPKSDRGAGGIFWSGNYFILNARASYTPTMVAEVTLNHAARGQMSVSLGTANTLATSPTTIWTSGAVNYSGGSWSFNGTTTAVDGAFVFDYSDIAPANNTIQRWFVGISDRSAGNPATIKAFKLYKPGAGGDTLISSSTSVPQTIDATRRYIPADGGSAGPANQPPVASISANPTSGYSPVTVNFNASASSDPDGQIVSYKWNFGDSRSGTGAQVNHTYSTAKTYTVTLTVTDNSGVSASSKTTINVLSGTITSPSTLSAKTLYRKVTLTWRDRSNNETGFYIERATVLRTGTSAFIQVGSAPANLASFSEQLTPGTYKYRVRAYSSIMGRYSGYSSQLNVTVR